MARPLLPLWIMRNIIKSVLACALFAGCAGGYGYTATATVSSPNGNYVEVSPGVYAVEDVDAPVYYTGNEYWLYSNGGWYRSHDYHGGWRHEERAPVALMRIDPYAYRYHRGYRGRNEHARREVRVVAPPHDYR